MTRLILFAVVMAAAGSSLAQTKPTKVEIRRGFAVAATEPSERQQMMLEQIARQIEPELTGSVARLPAYVDFFKRESICDPRLFACDVSTSIGSNGAIVLGGFVEYEVHRQAIELLLRTLGLDRLENRIELRGESELAFGVVKVPQAFLHDRVAEPRENLTQVLFGEPVYILRVTDNGYFWIHSSDGYVGYVKGSDVAELNREEFTRYQQTARTILRRDIDSKAGKLPAGSRVAIKASRGNEIQCTALGYLDFEVPASAIDDANESRTLQRIEGVILAANKLIGTPYVWGGRTAAGIDCSGLSQTAYQSQGINLPRDADQQAYVGRMVALHGYRDAMARGDLMFFIGRRGNIGHVAIYLGDNQFIEAADGGVKISSMDPKDENYEPKREHGFAFARRVIE